MTWKAKIYPYKLGSKSGKALADSLNCLRVRANDNYRPKENHVIINWGSSTPPNWDYRYNHILNHFTDIRRASNKLTTFEVLSFHEVPTPEWTRSPETADNWILEEGYTVYGRQTLTGHSGQGILILTEELHLPRDLCPLYTKATKAKHEYRIHVGDAGNTTIDMVQKKKRLDFEGGIPGIRSHANGWVFARQDVTPPECVILAAKAAVKALGLDFGAVDVGYNETEDKAYVYEVNTAPGLEGTTLLKYTEYFKGKLI